MNIKTKELSIVGYEQLRDYEFILLDISMLRNHNKTYSFKQDKLKEYLTGVVLLRSSITTCFNFQSCSSINKLFIF